MSCRLADTPPVVTGLCDYIAGLFIAKAVMIALYHRDVHDAPGQLIDNAAAENALRIAGDPHITAHGLGVPQFQRPGSQYPSWPAGALRMAGLFETGDGKFVNLHPGSPGTSIWENFCRGLGRPDVKLVFGEDGVRLARVEVDRNGDDRPERILHYTRGAPSSESRDTDGDGTLDTFDRRSPEGAVLVREQDVDGDGAIDLREVWSHGTGSTD